MFMKEYIVSQKSNDPQSFATVNEALKKISEDRMLGICPSALLSVYPGIYKEKIEITLNNLCIRGMGNTPSDTVLTFDDFARDKMPDGSNRGTFRSYSVLIDASNVRLENLTVSNTSGDEHAAGQAIALYADGDNLEFDNIRLEGRQDTLFTGPLPPKEIQPGGFIGPKQFSPRINGHHYYRSCYICGNIDFIFGSATAYFEDCTIESLSHGEEPVQGYVTAPSTPEGQPYGYVFKNCSFISSQCPDISCYLARPWRDYAKSVFIDCTVGSHIKNEGFHDWNKALAREKSFFAVSGCIRENGAPFTASADFARKLDNSSESTYNRDVVLASDKV